MSVRFEFDYSEVKILEEKLQKLPGETEKTINDILHKTGVRIVQDKIISRMPVSDKNKKHAKLSNPLRSENFNLGFEIKPKRQFNYLVFPNNALGTSYGGTPQEFMETGLGLSTKDIIEEINQEIDRKLKEELG
nr:hypothetical protein 8 [Bacillaceae bacterium]